MKSPLSFVCPLTRSDLEGLATMKHCPQCDFDIPNISGLTPTEARRVLAALACAQELSADLRVCGAVAHDADGHAQYVRPEDLPEDLPPEVASLFDDRATFLLALSAVTALGFSLGSVFISSIFAPKDPDMAVFVLDEDGPRFAPERAEAHADALDAAQDAWVTINLANIRADLLGATRPEPARTEPEPPDADDDARAAYHRRVAQERQLERTRERQRRELGHDRPSNRSSYPEKGWIGIVSGTR